MKNSDMEIPHSKHPKRVMHSSFDGEIAPSDPAAM